MVCGALGRVRVSIYPNGRVSSFLNILVGISDLLDSKYPIPPILNLPVKQPGDAPSGCVIRQQHNQYIMHLSHMFYAHRKIAGLHWRFSVDVQINCVLVRVVVKSRIMQNCFVY